VFEAFGYAGCFVMQGRTLLARVLVFAKIRKERVHILDTHRVPSHLDPDMLDQVQQKLRRCVLLGQVLEVVVIPEVDGEVNGELTMARVTDGMRVDDVSDLDVVGGVFGHLVDSYVDQGVGKVGVFEVGAELVAIVPLGPLGIWRCLGLDVGIGGDVVVFDDIEAAAVQPLQVDLEGFRVDVVEVDGGVDLGSGLVAASLLEELGAGANVRLIDEEFLRALAD